MIVFPKLAYVALSLSQPFLIQEAVSFVQNTEAENNNDVGYGLIGGFALVYTGLAVSIISLPTFSTSVDLIHLDHYGLVVASHLSIDDDDARRPYIHYISKDAADSGDKVE